MPRPTTTIVGTPISSASLNFTPGLTPYAIVEQHPEAGGLELGGERLGGGALRAALLAGDDEVHVGRCDLAGPAQAEVVEARLGDRGDGARDTPTPYDPMVTVTSLPVSSVHLEPERLGVLAAELEDVADLDAAGDLERAAAVRAHVAGAHLGGLDHAVGGEVAAVREVDHVLAGLVGAGDPAGALDDPRVEQEPDARGALEAERARPDVALHERRVGGEVGLVERHDLGRATWASSRFMSTSRSPGTPIASGSNVPSGWRSLTMTFFIVSAATHSPFGLTYSVVAR